MCVLESAVRSKAICLRMVDTAQHFINDAARHFISTRESVGSVDATHRFVGARLRKSISKCHEASTFSRRELGADVLTDALPTLSQTRERLRRILIGLDVGSQLIVKGYGNGV